MKVKTYNIEKGEIKDFKLADFEIGKYSMSLNGFTLTDLLVTDNVKENIRDINFNIGYMFGIHCGVYRIDKSDIFGLFKIWRQDED